MKTEPTFTATIYVGMRELYTDTIRNVEMARKILRDYVACGPCVTLSETEYIYTNGSEPGFTIGLMNYPRFPVAPRIIREHAMKIAERLLLEYHQGKVSIVFPDTTVTLEAEDE